MPSESLPLLLEQCLSRGWDAFYGDTPAAAIAPLRAALSIAPDCGEAWAALADLASLTDRPALLGRAVAGSPGEWRWRLAWGEALLAADDDSLRHGAAALAVFAAAAAVRPDAAAARLGCGRALARLARPVEAIMEYREALALAGDDAEIARELATLYIRCDDPLAAAETLAPFTGARRADGDSLLVLARAWAALGENAKGLAALDRLTALDDDSAPAADELRAVLTAAANDPAAAPTTAYVRALFDRYAERFDTELVERLGYQGPQILAAAAARVLPGATGLRVLDLGCGTGLAGVALRPLAATLHGVDLSAGMIAQAEKRRLYDHLTVGGLVEALAATAESWDLLAAADVLMYVGPLAAVFAAAATALRPGGAFVFTVEAMDAAEQAAADGAGLYLRESRRYAHDAGYLRAGLAQVGLEVAALDTVVLRQDRRQPIYGYCVAAVRPAAAHPVAVR